MESYRVSLTKESLVFSAAHFITFQGDICERLHGHNYAVRCDVAGPLDQNHYVVDFIALREALQQIVHRLDHRVLLPTLHAAISVRQEDNEIVARFADRRWVFPSEDCVLLPVENTTAERLARYIGMELSQRLAELGVKELTSIEVAVDENHGQWGVWRRDFPRGAEDVR